VSIKPPSDLLLDVAKAADPATSAAAAERLAKIAASGGKPGPAFSEILTDVGVPSARPMNPAGQSEAAPPSRFSGPSVDANKKAYQGLEALLLQNLVETMMPDGSDLFGEGEAGTVWRSMLAEQLGTSLSKKIDLGVAPKYLHLGHGHGKSASKLESSTSLALDQVHHVTLKHV
jgi:peptidoglycan hydrolase FlgJ